MSRARVGFLGVGWIGRHRMEAMIETGCVEAVAIADPSPEMAAEATKLVPDALLAASLDEMLDMELDGVVIATPSAMHAEQSRRALERNLSVFCQKPLGRTADEVRSVVDTARAMDRLLAVDLSYRFTEAVERIAALVRNGELGRIFAVDLVFHNAYGPDKPWFYDPARSGGGCVMDLGIHLVDLALSVLDFPDVTDVSAHLHSGGEPLGDRPDRVEDHAIAMLRLSNEAAVSLACSWRLQAGRDAIISAAFYGTEGGAVLQNVGGSFYDFRADLCRGTSSETLSEPPDAWGGRAAADWARRLAGGQRFDPEAERLVEVARVLDRIYGR